MLFGRGTVNAVKGLHAVGEENRDTRVAEILCQMLFGHGSNAEGIGWILCTRITRSMIIYWLFGCPLICIWLALTLTDLVCEVL